MERVLFEPKTLFQIAKYRIQRHALAINRNIKDINYIVRAMAKYYTKNEMPKIKPISQLKVDVRAAPIHSIHCSYKILPGVFVSDNSPIWDLMKFKNYSLEESTITGKEATHIIPAKYFVVDILNMKNVYHVDIGFYSPENSRIGKLDAIFGRDKDNKKELLGLAVFYTDDGTLNDAAKVVALTKVFMNIMERYLDLQFHKIIERFWRICFLPGKYKLKRDMNEETGCMRRHAPVSLIAITCDFDSLPRPLNPPRNIEYFDFWSYMEMIEESRYLLLCFPLQENMIGHTCNCEKNICYNRVSSARIFLKQNIY